MAILAKRPNIFAIFFVIFGQIDVFYILAGVEVDGMRPNESTKNERKGAHGLNWKILSILRSFSKPNLKPISKFS